ncbi:MAG: peptidylprolyl isomerase [Candidatus Gracilibacteria bacterium]|nr:peptidylprolyl isomerase [Candidatus Gracilibacteria bacterium]
MQDNILRQGDIVAIMDTSLGEIKIKLFPEFAPLACENLITHSKNGYYNGIIFHRVMADFMIQGGDPTGTGRGGKSIFKGNFKDEFTNELSHIKGALSMANAGRNTNGSQFFIVHASATPWLDGNHTIFGQVVEGMETVDSIAVQKTDRNDKPLYDVVINGIQIKKFENDELIEY